MKKTIAIIGGGAAGMMAAATIKETNPSIDILLIEKNPRLGTKVLISGGGRCNVTTGLKEVPLVLKKYYRGAKFLTKALYHFSPSDVYTWFEDHGVPLTIEDDGRVFPQSHQGKDIVGVFEKICEKENISLLLRTAITAIEKKEDRFFLETTTGNTLIADAVILTTGGQAYRHTGSTGDGYTFAEAFGHTITPLAPSLNAFVVAEKWIHAHSGVSFTDVLLTSGKAFARGPILFTHTGITGPAVFALSSQVAFETYTKVSTLPITIDYAPTYSEEDIYDICAAKNSGETVLAEVTRWLPKSIAKEAIKDCGFEEHRLLSEIGKKGWRKIAAWIKRSPIHAIGRSPGSEFVTAGGVNTNEVSPATMESRLTPGLFFAGELLNVDGVTGGFNLQASWATGRLAGIHAAT